MCLIHIDHQQPSRCNCDVMITVSHHLLLLRASLSRKAEASTADKKERSLYDHSTFAIMTDLPQMSLPTLDKLGASIPANLDALKVASEWFAAFASSVEAAKIPDIMSHLSIDAAWRDYLSITFDFRTFYGSSKIEKFLQDRIANAGLKAFKLESAELNQFTPTLAWIQGLFNFEIGDVGGGTGIFRLIPTSTGEWKAHGIFTNLNSLKDHPEQIGRNRDPFPAHGLWEDRRRKERDFADTEPYVIVIGGGQCGLAIAARLKYLDVPTLVLEKNARLGDNWRLRYEALCLHDPVCEYFIHLKLRSDI